MIHQPSLAGRRPAIYNREPCNSTRYEFGYELYGSLNFRWLSWGRPRACQGLLIVSTTGSDSVEIILGGAPPQVLVASWSSLNTYTDVVIAADIGGLAGSSQLVSAYLTTSIGPGTSVANQIGYSTVVAPLQPALTTLFQGVTLSPGTYFLTMVAADPYIATWLYARDPSLTTAPGAALGLEGTANELVGVVNLAYFPASTFSPMTSPNLELTVTGTAVPEPPPGLFAVGPALVLLIALFRWSARAGNPPARRSR